MVVTYVPVKFVQPCPKVNNLHKREQRLMG